MEMNGISTGFIPSQVKNKKMSVKYQNKLFLMNILLYCLFLFFKLRINIIAMEAIRANTPPSLFGIDRRIA